MKMSSQSENEWSSTLISTSDGPGISDEPLISQDAVPATSNPIAISPFGRIQDTFPIAGLPSRIVTSAETVNDWFSITDNKEEVMFSILYNLERLRSSSM